MTRLTKVISPKTLLTKLTDLNENERIETVRWKGKLLPEVWVMNINGTWETDEEMVGIVMKKLEASSNNNSQIIDFRDSQSDGKTLINEIIKSWNERESTNFLVTKPDCSNIPILSESLGFHKKKRVYNSKGENMLQKPTVELPKQKYDYYFDEIIRRMSQQFSEDENELAF